MWPINRRQIGNLGQNTVDQAAVGDDGASPRYLRESMKGISARAVLLVLALAYARAGFAQVASAQPIRIEAATTSVDLQPDGRYVEIKEVQARVQTQAAVQQISQMPFAFDASMQRFEVTQAYTLKADGHKVDVNKDSIFTRDFPMSAGAPMFADIKMVMIVFPEVTVGDSVYARVRLEQTEAMFPGHYSNFFVITPHTLVDRQSITMRAPSALHVFIDNEGFAENRTEAGGTTTYQWTAEQTTVDLIEPGSVSPIDYSRRLSISTFASFSDFTKAYAARAAKKAEVTQPIRKLVDELTASVPTDNKREQAKRLYEWVTENIRYVGIFLGAGAVVPHAADQVLSNRYGDCKDYVTLLTALLAAKGIEARTAIINAGVSFWVSKLPLLQNFNHVITYVPALDLFLDPTSGAPFGRLPGAVQGKTAVLVPSGELRRTASDKNTDNVTVRHVTFQIQDNGSIDATTEIEARGIRAERYRAFAKNLTDQDVPEFVRRMTSDDRYKGEGTVEFNGTNEKGGAMTVTVKYRLRGGIDWPGNGSFSVPAGFFGFENLSTQLNDDAANRKRPGYRGSPDTLVEEYEIKLPANMNVLALPENVTFRNELASYDAAYKREGQRLLITRKLVDLYEDPVMPPTAFKASEAKSDVIARDLRAQIVYLAR
jgi:transglutaminase-like putative cysteine protease